PLVTIGLFAVAQRVGLHNHPALALLFLALLIGTAATLAAQGRRSGLQIGVAVSRVEGVGLVLASIGLGALYAWRLDAWQFSYIGDEWSFFETADAWAQHDLLQIPWLEANGVWGFFPAALAGWQTLFMRFFGRTNFSWRLSMAVLVVSCLSPLYFTLRHFLAKASATPRIAAAFGCGSFFLSEFIVVWARIGKPPAASPPPAPLCRVFLLRRSCAAVEVALLFGRRCRGPRLLSQLARSAIATRRPLRLSRDRCSCQPRPATAAGRRLPDCGRVLRRRGSYIQPTPS